jgi:hypothetical protein
VQAERSLVAGNVTGGGGKATTTKTKRHRVPAREAMVCENKLSADRETLTATHIPGYKRAVPVCTCGIANSPLIASAVSKGKSDCAAFKQLEAAQSLFKAVTSDEQEKAVMSDES